jgi:hypothetical protein
MSLKYYITISQLIFLHTDMTGFLVTFYNAMLKKWLRYQRVISLETRVGITNQRNKWANTDPRIYRRWDQVKISTPSQVNGKIRS